RNAGRIAVRFGLGLGGRLRVFVALFVALHWGAPTDPRGYTTRLGNAYPSPQPSPRARGGPRSRHFFFLTTTFFLPASAMAGGAGGGGAFFPSALSAGGGGGWGFS